MNFGNLEQTSRAIKEFLTDGIKNLFTAKKTDQEESNKGRADTEILEQDQPVKNIEDWSPQLPPGFRRIEDHRRIGENPGTAILFDLDRPGARGYNMLRMEAFSGIAVDIIRSMDPMSTAESNVHFNFGEKPELHQHARMCIRSAGGSNIDPLDLSVAFSNQLTIHKRDDVDWKDPSMNFIRRGVNPYPEEVVKKAMTWLTDMAIKYSSFWVKWNCNIPKEALSSVDAFEVFINSFDPSTKRSEEELRSNGCE